MAAKKNALLCVVAVVCAVISVADYCYDGDIPVLSVLGLQMTRSSSSGLDPPPTTKTQSMDDLNTPQRCDECMNCSTTASLNGSNGAVTDAWTHDHELVPLSVLKRKVAVSAHKGLALLDHISLSRYYECERKSSKARTVQQQQQQQQQYPGEEVDQERNCVGERTFKDRNENPITALVSFHGSGNTWVRHLLEQATGIFTGSVYCDAALRKYFPGESVVSGSVLVVKTHRGDSRALPKQLQIALGQEMFDRAIVVVRDPYDALLSEANRRWNSKLSVNGHVGLADQTAFISNSKWDWLIEYKGAAWSFLVHTWLSQQPALPLHVVQYERLQTSLRAELEKMLLFLGFNASNETLDCVTANSEGRFKRATHLDFDPYSQGNREAMNRFLRQAAPLLARHGIQYNLR